jgi:hypothetical protein
MRGLAGRVRAGLLVLSYIRQMPGRLEAPWARGRPNRYKESVEPTAERELVSGVVERITYHDQESGFAVLRVRAPGVADLTTVVGRMPAIASGEAIQAGGVWVRDRTHGMQFQAAWVRTAAPTSAEGLEKYLRRAC